MKRFFALMLAILMVASLCACKKDEGATKSYPVMTDMVMRYGSGDETREVKTEIEYDDAFNIVGYKMYMDGKLYTEGTLDGAFNRPLLEKDYGEDGTVEYTTTYTYDANGNELSSTRKDKDGALVWANVYTYTAEGWLATEEWDYGEDETDWTKYTYDSHGNKISLKSGSGEEIWSEYTYENTYSGDKLTEVKSYRDGVLQELFRYDADGNQILEVSYNSEGEETYRCEETYQNGKIMLVVSAWGVEEESRREYIYNDAGNVIEIRYTETYMEETSESKTLITYDNGVIVSVKEYDNGELESEYVYNYKTETMSKEQADKLAEFYSSMVRG